jgi:hypothetical protein
MTDIDAIYPSFVGILPIHFEVPRHYLPLSTFIETASQTRAIIEDFNRELFDGGLSYELFVLPPLEGSFKSRLGIAVGAGAGLVVTFVNSDVGSAFIEGLTKHNSEYWAEAAGDFVRTRVVEGELQHIQEHLAPTKDDEGQCRVATSVLIEATKSFLQTDYASLRKVGITAQKYRDAFEARNEFYKACVINTEIEALGFDDTEDFPIKRRNFAELQVALQPREEQASLVSWEVEILILKVTSPNWDREDKQRHWKARDSKERERYFKIEDEQFWALVQRKNLNPHIVDVIKVQWAYNREGNQKRNFRVLRVLEYNDQKLAEPLDDNALRAVLGFYDVASIDMLDLFNR